MNPEIIKKLKEIINSPLAIEVIHSALIFAVELQPDTTLENINAMITINLDNYLEQQIKLAQDITKDSAQPVEIKLFGKIIAETYIDITDEGNYDVFTSRRSKMNFEY